MLQTIIVLLSIIQTMSLFVFQCGYHCFTCNSMFNSKGEGNPLDICAVSWKISVDENKYFLANVWMRKLVFVDVRMNSFASRKGRYNPKRMPSHGLK